MIDTAKRHHIRWMISRDVPEVLQIERLASGLGWNEETLLAVLRNRNSVGMIAEPYDNADIIKGFFVYELFKHKIQILNLCVHPEWQRSGIGVAIADKLKSKLSTHRRTMLFADVPEDKLPMQLFLRSQGFKCIAIAGNVYRFTFQGGD